METIWYRPSRYNDPSLNGNVVVVVLAGSIANHAIAAVWVYKLLNLP